jgi:uncharacterized protein
MSDIDRLYESIKELEGSGIYVSTAKGRFLVHVSVRDDDVGRRVGYQGRKKPLGPSEGMLFVFPQDAHHSMWMRDTYIPLDMIFVDKKWKIVDISHDVKPAAAESIYPSSPCRYVLEVGGKWCKDRGVVVGDMIEQNLSRTYKNAKV